MNIDWGQIATHIIGFLIAVWLLKKYAWSGLLGFVDKRKETIASSFEEIEREKAAVLAQKQHYDAEIEGIEATRRERIQRAAEEAEKLANEIKEDARREAVATREKAKQDIEIELDKANTALKDRMVNAVFTATEKLLHEQLDKEKHAKLVDTFLSQVKAD